jgi:hypothetical protein
VLTTTARPGRAPSFSVHVTIYRYGKTRTSAAESTPTRSNLLALRPRGGAPTKALRKYQ